MDAGKEKKYYSINLLELVYIYNKSNWRVIVTIQATVMFGLGFLRFSGNHFEFAGVIFIMTV